MILPEAQHLHPGNAVVHNFKALTLHALGRRGEAFALLGDFVCNNTEHIWHCCTLALCHPADPAFRALRGEPRLRDLLAGRGLPAE